MSATDADPMAYGESWYAATMVEAPPRPALAFDLDVDVCVIGGGLAGLTTARELARSGWSVVLLEAGRIAANASGRNTGFVLPGFAADAEKLVARVGFDRTKDLWALAQAGLDYVRDAVRSGALTGVEPQPGWLYVSKVNNGDDWLRYVQRLGELGCDIEGWPADRVRSVLRSERYFHAINFAQAMAIHPLNYALGLAAAAERDGARLFENTPALSIDPSGVRKRIVTPGARLRASHVVLCGNVQLGKLMPRLAATLVPITTYVITTAPLGDRLGEIVGYRGAVSDSDLADNHYRIVGGDRLMWSGRGTVWRRNPRRYVAALTADIKKTYPQLGDVAAEYAWSGTLGNTLHRMPQIGELGPGVWLASGFGGHGLNTTAMAGTLIARAIVAGDQSWKQFTPFELVWAGGIAGRAAVQMRLWTKRWRAAVDQRRAKAREVAHLKARETEQAEQPVQVAQNVQEAKAEQEAPAPQPEIMESGAQQADDMATRRDPAHVGSDGFAPPPVGQHDDTQPSAERHIAPSPAPSRRKKRRHRAET
jgi:glycine/D-amino acid oxidase-like deaminating enzyme